MNRIWAYVYAWRGRTDVRGSIEHRLYNWSDAYVHYYWTRRANEEKARRFRVVYGS